MALALAALLSSGLLVSPASPPAARRLPTRPRTPSTTLAAVDLFAEPLPPSVGGKLLLAPAPNFPPSLESPPAALPASITPFPALADVFLAPLAPADLAAALSLALALLLGPDFLLAPAGLVSRDGIRPGRALERVLGERLEPDAPWLRDRREGLAADAPLAIKAIAALLFGAAGLLLERLLLLALEDVSFVLSVGICACIGAGLLEVIRDPLPTREERDWNRKLVDEFFVFASERLQPTGRCHESEIVRAFRAYYPRYRRSDMRRTEDGVSLPDERVAALVRSWNGEVGRPAVRTPAGYWKGISVAPAERDA
ncbi:hypothetical protein AB1Y20_013854 [Prymnesium parvum]|uniref:Uncharacterized protein n=1 Tax=Prymnesium parvum TaxID=97485 RepID=A0AB34IFN0_PRYPA